MGCNCAKISFLLLIIIFLLGGFFIWRIWWVLEEEGKMLPKDFELYYSFGVNESNILDTKNNLYKKDMVCDSPLSFTVKLSENEKKEIYNTIAKNNFFNLKENMLPSGGVAACLPGFGFTLRVTANEKTKTIRWICGYPEDDPDYLKLKNITNVIDNVILQKEKEMSIPEPRCVYQ